MLFSLLGLFAGCQPSGSETPTAQPPSIPWQASVVEVGEQSVNTEQISDLPARGAVPIEPADVLAVQGDETRLFEALQSPRLVAYDIDSVLAAAWWQGTLLMATDTGLVSWNNGLVSTDLNNMIHGVTDLVSLKSGLWMQTADGLYVLRNGALSQITVDSTPAHGFARGTAALAPVVWTAAGDQVVALNFNDSGLTAYESYTMFGPVQDVAATLDGRVLALVDGWLVERRSSTDWERLDLGEPVRELLGRRGAAAIWARTDTRWIHIADEFNATDVPIDATIRADPLGRLIASGDDVTRYAVGFPLLLLGVPTSNVLTPVEVRVIPTAPDLNPTLTVLATSVSGEEQVLLVEDHRVLIDPEALPDGPLTLQATAVYSNETSVATATLVIGADFVPTWPEHIQPIYLDQCTPCHEPGQGILELDTEQAWLSYLSEGPAPGSPGILERITLDNMPSDARQLTATEKFLVLEWRRATLP